MSIVTGLTGLRAAAELTRMLREGLKSGQIKGDDIAGRIGEIYDYIVDSKDALVEAKDEIQELKGQIAAFNDERAFKTGLDFDLCGIYKRKGPQGEELYCSACLDAVGLRVRVRSASGGYRCHKHGLRET
jgi:hypothetical protein